MTYVALGPAGDVAPGQVAAYRVGSAVIAVANVDGRFYAFDDACPHAACPLTRGTLSGRVIRCWCHESEFDVATGEVLAEPAEEPLTTYEVRVSDGVLQVAAG